MEVAEPVLSGRPERIRSFVGVGLPETQRGQLAAFIDSCRGAAPELSWVAAANLHLTLRFLGSVEAGTLERLAVSLRELPFTPFEARLGGLGSFGRGSGVRVLWIGILAGGEELARLAAEIEWRCREAGLEPEERPYSPHLTLARARDRRGARVPELPAPPELAPWMVGTFRLYRSRTGPGGAVHSGLEEFGR